MRIVGKSVIDLRWHSTDLTYWKKYNRKPMNERYEDQS